MNNEASTFDKTSENTTLPNQPTQTEVLSSASEIIQPSTNSTNATDTPTVLQDRHVASTPRDDIKGVRTDSLFTPQKTNIVFIVGIVLMVISIIAVAISFAF
jgi:hypothetical protein